MNTFFQIILCLAIATWAPICATEGYQTNSFTLQHLDQVLQKLIEETPLSDRAQDRIRGYLFHAQKQALEKENGSMDQFSLHVIQLFYPKYQPAAAPMLMPELDQRYKDEQGHIHPTLLKMPGGGWEGTLPYHGIEISSWKPWVLQSADQFRVAAPPTEKSFWTDQLAKVKVAMQNATLSQRQRISYWAGKPDIASGDWIVILNQYMLANHTPLLKQIQVRDAVAKATVDATIAAFDSKYAYLVKRPVMLDPDLKTVISTPNHPTFPSAHSTVSAAVVEVLLYYFPENRCEWLRLLEEAGLSRIWAGIHFPIDHEAGKSLGKKVGHAILKALGEPLR